MKTNKNGKVELIHIESGEVNEYFVPTAKEIMKQAYKAKANGKEPLYKLKPPMDPEQEDQINRMINETFARKVKEALEANGVDPDTVTDTQNDQGQEQATFDELIAAIEGITEKYKDAENTDHLTEGGKIKKATFIEHLEKDVPQAEYQKYVKSS